jgi:hypothetical protein
MLSTPDVDVHTKGVDIYALVWISMPGGWISILGVWISMALGGYSSGGANIHLQPFIITDCIVLSCKL